MSAVTQLGYLVFEVSDLAAWERFGVDVMGLGLAHKSEQELHFRLDSYATRFFITTGPADDLSVVGWEVADEAALVALQGRLEAKGVQITDGTAEEAAARGVARLIKLLDPAGTPTEVFYGPEKVDTPIESVVQGGFVAEDKGLGHIVLTALDEKESHEFYTDLLGFAVSDRIRCTFHGFKVDLAFYHAGNQSAARHHTVALGGPQKKRVHHFMVEAREMDEVGLAFDRCLKGGFRIMQTIGRHPNDRMFSFYCFTPSKFQLEFGWGGREVNDATWEPTEYNCISEWGHHPPMVFAPPPKR